MSLPCSLLPLHVLHALQPDPAPRHPCKGICRELHQQMVAFAAGLRSLGVQAGDRVSLFSENSSRWLIADQGIMFNGAADAVRLLAIL